MLPELCDRMIAKHKSQDKNSFWVRSACTQGQASTYLKQVLDANQKWVSNYDERMNLIGRGQKKSENFQLILALQCKQGKGRISEWEK
jgi:hypothetical protein